MLPPLPLSVCVESALRVGPELRISSALLALSRSGYTLKVKHGHVVAIVATKEVDRERERDRRKGDRVERVVRHL